MTWAYSWVIQLAQAGWLPAPLAEPFMARAAVAILVLGPLLGLLGPLVQARRLAFYSSAIGHAALTGVAVGVLLGEPPHQAWVGVFGTCLAVGLILTYLRRHSRLGADSLVGVLLAFTLGLGICLLTLVTRRFDIHQLEGAMFGGVLTLGDGDLALLLGVGALVLALLLPLHDRLWLVSVAPEASRARGLRAGLLDYLFTVLLTLTLAAGLKVVGALLVEGMVLVPAAASRNLAGSLRGHVLGSVLLATACAQAGLLLSFYFPVPTGAAIVVALSAAFLLTWALDRLRAGSG